MRHTTCQLEDQRSDSGAGVALSTFRVIILREEVAAVGALRGIEEALLRVRVITRRLLAVRLELELLVRLAETGRVKVELALRRRRRRLLSPVISVLAGVSGHLAGTNYFPSARGLVSLLPVRLADTKR